MGEVHPYIPRGLGGEDRKGFQEDQAPRARVPSIARLRQ